MTDPERDGWRELRGCGIRGGAGGDGGETDGEGWGLGRGGLHGGSGCGNGWGFGGSGTSSPPPEVRAISS